MNDRVLMSHSSILFNPKWPFLRQIGKGVDLGPFVFPSGTMLRPWQGGLWHHLLRRCKGGDWLTLGQDHHHRRVVVTKRGILLLIFPLLTRCWFFFVAGTASVATPPPFHDHSYPPPPTALLCATEPHPKFSSLPLVLFDVFLLYLQANRAIIQLFPLSLLLNKYLSAKWEGDFQDSDTEFL